jgi:hypothetical protein
MKGQAVAWVGVLLVCHMLAKTGYAHGGEVRITLASWAPDPEQPLTRLYQAHVLFANDEEPVVGARLAFSASREEGDGTAQVGDVSFAPVPGSPGAYVTQVQYPRFGTWDIILRTEVPGRGEVSTIEQISPARAGSTAAAVQAPSQLSVLLAFDWRDVLNILVRTGHSVGAAAYLGLTGALMIEVWFGSYLNRAATWRRFTRIIVPAALGSLAIVTVSGFYTGYFDGPVHPPGVFDVQAMENVPYGSAYLVAFWLKPILGLAVLAILARARHAPRPAHAWIGVHAVATRLSVGYGALVVLLLANVVVLVYLHSLSHLSVSLAPR